MFRLLSHRASKTWRRPCTWLRLPALALAVLAFACSEQPAALDPSERELTVAKGPPAKCNAGTDLSITFREGSGGTEALRSDCADPLTCPYVEGQDNVGAHINDPTGNLMLWPSQYGETTRLVNVLTTDGAFQTVGRIYTNNHDNDGDGDVESCGLKGGSDGLAPGATGDAVLEAELGDGNGIVRYGKDCNGALASGKVETWRSDDGGTWTITGESGVHCRKDADAKPRDPLKKVGDAGPFEMTLEAI